jgi:hypothetical protein
MKILYLRRFFVWATITTIVSNNSQGEGEKFNFRSVCFSKDHSKLIFFTLFRGFKHSKRPCGGSVAVKTEDKMTPYWPTVLTL